MDPRECFVGATLGDPGDLQPSNQLGEAIRKWPYSPLSSLEEETWKEGMAGGA